MLSDLTSDANRSRCAPALQHFRQVSNPLTIITQDQTPTGEQTIQQSLSMWTGVRVLYPDPGDTLYVGSIQGHIITANPISLPERHRA